jgi:WD40 repeat protein
VVSPDGGRIACPTGPVGATEIWDLQKRSLWGFIPEQVDTLRGGEKLLVFTPDGKLAIMRGRDDKIRVWQLTEGQWARRLTAYDVETRGINTLAMSPKGDVFAYGRQDGTVVVARVPLFITGVARQGDQLVLEWLGGSGRYQVQRRATVAGGPWENVGGPTTDTSLRNSISGAAAFYRIQGLTN